MYLAAAVVLFGLLTSLNVALTVGVIRRLREHTTELAALRNRGGDVGGDVALPTGETVGSFTAADTDGRQVDLATLGDRPLVGFFSPSCEPCKERLPHFVEYAATRSGGRDNVLAVVVGSVTETADVVAGLRTVATVVVEPDQGPVQKAFGVTGFPAFVLVENTQVAASGFNFEPVAERDTAAVPLAG